jgi:putative membrane protein
MDSTTRARAIGITTALIGLLAGTGIIAYFNFGTVLAAIRPIGIDGFLIVILAQAVLFIPLGVAWRVVAPGRTEKTLVFILGRIMREAASDVLPFSQIGGIVISARVAVLGGVSSATAFGSTLVDITVEIVAMLIYTLCGLALLARRLSGVAHSGQMALTLVGGIAIAIAVVAGFVATQKQGLRLTRRLVDRMVPSASHQTQAIIAVIETSYGKPVGLAICLALHVIGWFGAAAGTWLILDFIGRPIPYLSVVAIESLLYTVRNAAFIVPSGLGIQEGAYALLGPLFGLPVEAALALSLLKRARDIVIGVPVLVVWQLVESRRSLTAKATDREINA